MFSPIRRSKIRTASACANFAVAIALAASSTLARADVEPGITVSVERADEGYVVVATLLAPVTRSAVWAVFTDFEHMADFLPTLTASRVLQRSDNLVLVRQQGRMEFGTFRMPFESDRKMELIPPGLIRSQQVRGNMKSVESTTAFVEVQGGTRVDYRVQIVPKLWMPEGIAGPMLRESIEGQFNAMLREILRRKTE